MTPGAEALVVAAREWYAAQKEFREVLSVVKGYPDSLLRWKAHDRLRDALRNLKQAIEDLG